jgi:hypothetical protein
VPHGPGKHWKDGAFKRIEARNRAALKTHFAKAERIERGIEWAIAVNS